MEAANIEQLQQRAERNARADDGLDSFVRLARVKQVTGSSKSTIWRWIRAGKFPSPVVQDGNTVLWSLDQIRQWQSKLKSS